MLRKERSMTQEQLAEAMGVTIGAVSKWENALSNPDLYLIVELAQFFEVSEDTGLLDIHSQSPARLQFLPAEPQSG